MHRERDREESWAAFDVALRGLERPDPDPDLRRLCLPAELQKDHGARSRRILLVEDEAAIRRLIQFHLSRAGYEVMTAIDGHQALAQVREQRPDLMILDVMMPGPDGFQVLEVVKNDPRTAEIPVIMLTARGGDGPILHGWRTGVDFYMTKPFNPAELRAVVDRIAEAIGTPDNPPPLRRWLK